ncbi:DUF4362 domain-containing protein [Paenibacillus sp. FSL K6-3166]|uniref:DUF4362 domain-containing protein n=1 Tax=unclassified Paenibacillus TaxID=185978 RepID=UPI000BA172C1|nr:DUF4362 domain-containing protein [Paenibacillus sp. VTT E-133291]OZQ83763.1 hypothetical protein CA598_23570 [Paenibacillus sp. VTT E-133291]
MRSSGILLIFIALIVTGCFNQPSNGEDKFTTTINEQEDVINSHGMIVKNLKKLDAFIQNKAGTQRVVHYTIEGDPIFNDLKYTDQGIEMRHDNSEDTFGSPQVTTYTCQNLVRNETDKLLSYTLTGCEGEQAKIELLQIPFDVTKQDKFEFVLKYGVNQKNEINTIEKKLVKDLQNGEVVEVSDFELSEQERGQIYKEMVLANYLDEKELSTECNRKPAVSYDLSVQINSGERHYQWTECQNTEDDGQMTELAQTIIKIVQAGSIYKQLPEVKGHYE